MTGVFLVTGATGQVGRHVVRGLLARGHAVRALSRAPEKFGFPADVEVVRGDLTEPESVQPALTDAAGVYLLVGGEEPAILEMAREAGARRVVLLSSQSVESRPGNAIALRHQRAENAVRQSGIPWTFLRPGQFASNTLRWAPEIRSTGVVHAPFGGAALPSIHPADIAAVAVAALTESGHEGRAYPLTGPEPITPAQQVRTIGSVLGRDVSFAEITPEQARERMVREMPPAIADALLEVTGDAAERDVRVSPWVEKVTGTQPRTFKQWVADNREHFE